MNRATKVQASKFSAQRSRWLSSGEEHRTRNNDSKMILSIDRKSAKQSCHRIFLDGAIRLVVLQPAQPTGIDREGSSLRSTNEYPRFGAVLTTRN